MFKSLVISELLREGLINQEILRFEALKGGTLSSIYLLSDIKNQKYIVKVNKPIVLKAESFFLEKYNHLDITANLLYKEKDFKYIVYSYIKGNVRTQKPSKKEVLQIIVEQLINNYEIIDVQAGWGWIENRRDSWKQFLRDWIVEADSWILSAISKKDKELIYQLIMSPRRLMSSKHAYLLHGDCGMHNVIIEKNQVLGLIDPMPIVGYPIYDLIYAFCSTPELLTKEIIKHAASYLKIGEKVDDEILFEEVLIGLYCRIARCIKHHPNDLPAYLYWWDYWIGIIRDIK
ncbi:aminoglycoside phosphotransferase family protein [Bacillus thuringiensis]|uniref:aminoglycoside phosphotransferase n=1 Tax=Bacillus cereus group TaxID=86661 RepID=UPI000BEB588E|nr:MULTISPECIES: aminoglycoside phosphotransferase [Bacillus cereus group]MED3446805.1 aminoglycoside phosphotransferase family protein [Bacillus thuringiensis]PEB54493.1 aminoglycoside phosphotransferase [Bacillus cereus]PEB85640.1 aminoglycoside phosphotransferase [Bacillus thuringiensis]PGK93097.1 aminoglycoside phosphotransferase [Bacillus thuringiensis]PGV86387.1 aminoglycoside phosphotransferase [Bacillus thuringiensis]